MSFGYWFNEKIVEATDEQILSCFYEPRDLVGFEVAPKTWLGSSTGPSHWAYIHTKRDFKKIKYLVTGDCMQAAFNSREEMERVCQSVAGRFSRVLPTTMLPTTVYEYAGEGQHGPVWRDTSKPPEKPMTPEELAEVQDALSKIVPGEEDE